MANEMDELFGKVRDETHEVFATLHPTLRAEYLRVYRGKMPDEIVDGLQAVHEAALRHEAAEKESAEPLQEEEFLVIVEQGYARFRKQEPLDEEALDRLADFIYYGFMGPKNPPALRFHFLKLVAHKHFSEELANRFNRLLFKTATPETIELVSEQARRQSKRFDD